MYHDNSQGKGMVASPQRSEKQQPLSCSTPFVLLLVYERSVHVLVFGV